MEARRPFSVWLRLGFALSGTAVTALLMQTESWLNFCITGLLALVLMLFITLKTGVLEAVFSHKSPGVMLVSGILTLSELYMAKSTFFTCCHGWLKALYAMLHLPLESLLLRCTPWAVALLALPAMLGAMLWFVDFLWGLGKELWSTSDYMERMFFLAAAAFYAIIILFTYQCTQAFYGAHINGRWYNFDLVYSADSGYLANQDVFRVVGAEQNDLRQPLFGLFAMPFSQAAYLISRLLPFVPYGYLLVSQLMQMALFLVAVVVLGRMMQLPKMEQLLFMTLLCSTYPVLIFSVTVEQYLFACSYLIFMIYRRREPVAGSAFFIAATGSLLTTGALFPAVTWDRSFPKFAKNTLKLCGAFFAVTILSGRLTTFLDIPSYIEGYAYYAGGDVPALSKLLQYVNFVGSCLAAPLSGLDFTTYRHASWQMLPVTQWRMTGVFVIIMSVVGVIVTWKQDFSKICGGWMLFSFVLLGLVGWGTIDNGLMLYTLYFGWAFLAMMFQGIHVCLKKFPLIKYPVFLLLLLVVVFWNILSFRDVLVFATQFYPTLG